MTARATLRDLPALSLLFAAILALGALGMSFAKALDLADRGSLRSITGRVEGETRTYRSKVSPKLNIFVRTTDRVLHLTQDDLSGAVPEILTLRVGDTVTALVKSDFLGRDLEW